VKSIWLAVYNAAIFVHGVQDQKAWFVSMLG
jgi:hypothetical protein